MPITSHLQGKSSDLSMETTLHLIQMTFDVQPLDLHKVEQLLEQATNKLRTVVSFSRNPYEMQKAHSYSLQIDSYKLIIEMIKIKSFFRSLQAFRKEELWSHVQENLTKMSRALREYKNFYLITKSRFEQEKLPLHYVSEHWIMKNFNEILNQLNWLKYEIQFLRRRYFRPGLSPIKKSILCDEDLFSPRMFSPPRATTTNALKSPLTESPDIRDLQCIKAIETSFFVEVPLSPSSQSPKLA